MLMWQGYFCVVKARKKKKKKRKTMQTNKQTNKQRKSTPGRTGPGPEDNTKSVKTPEWCALGEVSHSPSSPVSQLSGASRSSLEGRGRRKGEGGSGRGRKRKGRKQEEAGEAEAKEKKAALNRQDGAQAQYGPDRSPAENSKDNGGRRRQPKNDKKQTTEKGNTKRGVG